jgi:hypothetical protein
MKQSCVSAFARGARRFALAAVALGFGATSLLAQSTGKIEGRVRDQAGAPIANAQVVIVGTAFSALTNPEGYYFINNVPSQTVTMRAAFIGYRAVRAEGIRVLAGQTITQDFALQATTVEVQEIAVQSTQPLVPRDEVTSKQRVDGSFTDKLPVDRIAQVLTLQPGVVASTSGNTLSIRGGREDEAATYVDGVPVTPGNRGVGNGGGNTIGIATNSFEEASVTTGASSAEFGNAQSGIINISTRTGSSTGYSGNLGWESDDMFPNGIGFNRIQASFGGPLMGGLTFFLSGALEGSRYSYGGRGSEEFPTFIRAGVDTTVAVPLSPGASTSDTSYVDVYNLAVARGECERFEGSANPDIASNYGVDCQGTRNPRNAASVYQLQGKLNYSYGSGSRMAFLVLASQGQGRGGLTFNSNPSLIAGDRNWNRVYQLNWTQNLSRSTERALALDASVSYQQDRRIAGPLTATNELDTRNKFGGFLIAPLEFLFDFESFPLDSQLIENYRTNDPTSRRTPYDLQNTDQYRTVNQFRDDAYGQLGPSESGAPGGAITLYRENRLIGKAAVDWQFDRYNRLRFGGEYTAYESDYYNHNLTSQAFSNAYIEEPRRWSGFVEDRLDLGDVVVVGGLRYDAYDTRASRPYALDTIQTLPGGAANPTFGSYQPFPRISSYTDADGLYTCAATVADCTAGTALPLVGFIRDEKHSYVSPHIQVAFPVTEKTNFRLSYAHQVQTPDFGILLNGINTDLSITNTNNIYGSDLDFGKSITFEFGIRHAFSDDMVLDVAAYNKDNLSNAAARLISRRDPTRQNTSVDLREMTNADFGNARGIDVRLDRRIGNFFNGTIAYSYSSAKNTGSDPFTYTTFGSRVVNAVSGGNQPPPQATAPTDESRPHNLAGALSLNFPGDFNEGTLVGSLLGNSALFATFRFASGTAYTRCSDEGNESTISGQVCAEGGFEGGLNTARLPTFKQFDLKFTKGFGLGGLDLTAYVDARNVLNFRNVLAVFVETNDVVNADEFDDVLTGDLSDYQDEAAENGILNDDDSIDLTFGGDGNAGCANYVTVSGQGAAPSCIYLIRAEQRWGNGDGILTLDEQTTLSRESYLLGRGIHQFVGPGRRLRLGLEVNF